MTAALWDAEKVWSWVEEHARIRNERGREVPFRLNSIQSLARDQVGFFGGAERQWSVIVKPRQVGFTSLWMAWATAAMITHPGLQILAVTPSEKTHPEILAKWRSMQTLIRSSGAGVHPGPAHDNAGEYDMRNGSRLAWHIIGGTEGSAESVGRGGTYQAVILTELAFVIDPDAAAAAIAALLPAIDNAGASVLVDSTPNGTTGPGLTYYDLVQRVGTGDMSGGVHFWPWWLDDSKRDSLSGRDPVKLAGSLTKEERELMQRERLTLGQIAWRRRRMRYPNMNARQGRLRFLQEYPESLEGCFRRPSSAIFDAELLEDLQVKHQSKGFTPPLTRPEVIALFARMGLEVRPGMIEARAAWDGLTAQGYCRIWRPPTRDEPSKGRWQGRRRARYFIGVDSSDGRAKSDWQVATVLDREGAVCALARVRCDPMRFAALIQRLAILYGASVMVERQYGELIVEWLTQRVRRDQVEQRGRLWSECSVLAESYSDVTMQQTTARTRPQLIDAAMSSLEDPDGCTDPETLDEMTALRRHDGRLEASPGAHDDIIMSRGLAELHRRQTLASGAREQAERGRRIRAGKAMRRRRWSYLS